MPKGALVVAVVALLALTAALVAVAKHGSDSASPRAGTGSVPAGSSPYVAAYGTFRPFTTTGAGRTEIPLPVAARTAGIVSWDSADTSFGAVLKAGDGTEAGRLEGVGGSTGSAAYGLSPGEPSQSATSLEVLTDGPWTVTIAPVSSAPELPAVGTRGTGSRVYLYSGPPRSWVIHYRPRPRLWDGINVRQWPTAGQPMTGMPIGPLGRIEPYARSQTFRLARGPSVVLVIAWRDWSITQK